jgi:hypothetical protein
MPPASLFQIILDNRRILLKKRKNRSKLTAYSWFLPPHHPDGIYSVVTVLYKYRQRGKFLNGSKNET